RVIERGLSPLDLLTAREMPAVRSRWLRAVQDAAAPRTRRAISEHIFAELYLSSVSFLTFAFSLAFCIERVLVKAWAECRVVFGGTREVGASCRSSLEPSEGSVRPGRNSSIAPPSGRGCFWPYCLPQRMHFVLRLLPGSRLAGLRNASSSCVLSFKEIAVFARKL